MDRDDYEDQGAIRRETILTKHMRIRPSPTGSVFEIADETDKRWARTELGEAQAGSEL
jgi:hypothetical protein